MDRLERHLYDHGRPGGFAICTVLGGEILDENFQRIEQLQVAAPKIVYVRYTLPNESASQIPADLQTTDSDNATVASVPGVGLGRLGGSSVFLSGPVTVEPNQDELPSGVAGLRARTMDFPGTSIRAADGSGHLDATTASLAASVATLTGLVYDFRIGTLQDWREPNLLFGNGTDYTVMSLRITSADRSLVLPPGTVLEIAAQEANGTISSVASSPDSEGWWSFRYTAPNLPAGVPNSVLRPKFDITVRFPEGGDIHSYGQTFRRTDKNWGRCLLFETEPPGPETVRHCFGDPNFPIVYSRYDFRRLVFYDPPDSPVAVTDDNYETVSKDAQGIQDLLEEEASQAFLKDLYFVGDASQFDTSDDTNLGAFSRVGIYGGDPRFWPVAFIDLDGDGLFTSGQDAFLKPPSQEYVMPADGTPGVAFSHVLAHWCQRERVNPELVIVQLQKEQGTFRGAWQECRTGNPNPSQVISLEGCSRSQTTIRRGQTTC